MCACVCWAFPYQGDDASADILVGVFETNLNEEGGYVWLNAGAVCLFAASLTGESVSYGFSDMRYWVLKGFDEGFYTACVASVSTVIYYVYAVSEHSGV